ncbi:MAG: ATP-dependent DNA helicase RecG [Lachnospiraceae bacterium]|nr:ATP-dependent DNA helicase RecG [Lachnospiraceae bacterium]
MNGNDSVSVLKGIGPKTAALFGRLGVFTIEDLACLYPRYYITYEPPIPVEEVKSGQRAAVRLTLTAPPVVARPGNHFSKSKKLTLVTANGRDYTGTLRLVWYNMPYMKNQFHSGSTYIFCGTPVMRQGRLTLEHPEVFLENTYEKQMETLKPVYPLTAGLTNNAVVKAMEQIVPYLESMPDEMPKEVIDRQKLCKFGQAMREIHFPFNKERTIEAKKRLIFDEFFTFLVLMEQLKGQRQVGGNEYPIIFPEEVKSFLKELPYELTGAQKKALKEIETDLGSSHRMNRLIQGDVGSGKTIVAMTALYGVVKNGYQGALMAPTEVLARQHYEDFTKMLGSKGVRIGLLTGSQKKKEKYQMYEALAKGEIDIMIGTHALIQEKTVFSNLALVVTDEQHRFGVNQRKFLQEKGFHPHILVMSATPIPRTLAIIMYGDLDISIMDELPKERLPIKNCVVGNGYRPTAYRFMEQQIKEGRQVYIICPMVEESEALDAENVIEYTKQLEKNMDSTVRMEYLHGKMKGSEKEEIMKRFENHEIDLLISTTVIEVGINVPNATVMMIENSERFGLAQLHQLRGRVGRGKYQSYCIFMTASDKQEIKDRLEILGKSNDGFHIANEDLRLRGPGDFFGVRQSGDMDFVMADIYSNSDLLKAASQEVNRLKQDGFDFSSIKNNNIEKKQDFATQI